MAQRSSTRPDSLISESSRRPRRRRRWQPYRRRSYNRRHRVYHLLEPRSQTTKAGYVGEYDIYVSWLLRQFRLAFVASIQPLAGDPSSTRTVDINKQALTHKMFQPNTAYTVAAVVVVIVHRRNGYRG